MLLDEVNASTRTANPDRSVSWAVIQRRDAVLIAQRFVRRPARDNLRTVATNPHMDEAANAPESLHPPANRADLLRETFARRVSNLMSASRRAGARKDSEAIPDLRGW